MRICDCALGWGALIGTLICGCANGPVPLTFGVSGFGANAYATVVIPQKPAQVVPITHTDAVTEPTLIVPVGTEVGDKAVVPASATNSGLVVPIIPGDVAAPVLAVPVTKTP
jgi:hypothetical protein